ncbi:MAG: hypothetical protein DI535_17680 [Citrobacter freundii]|nr:MAG: hypothetical protein DI535_17680 [Citrobacter freundii]
MKTGAIVKPLKPGGRIVVLVTGIILLVAGMAALLYPFRSSIQLIKYLGPALFLNSLVIFLFALRFPKNSNSRNWTLLKSGLDLSFALVLSFNPFLTFIAFPLLAGPLMVCSGLMKIMGGLVIKQEQKSWPVTLSAGILFALFGILLTGASYGPVTNISNLTGLFAIGLGVIYLMDSLRSFMPANKIL